ncbi:hypothetical protein Sjap_019950 [Stephania japonica]|uniref:Chlororespiratory reduction 4 n=1 Tax=Stephania japonica TaxID=461633 RepID=A0AAP0EZR6_9MAGN
MPIKCLRLPLFSWNLKSFSISRTGSFSFTNATITTISKSLHPIIPNGGSCAQTSTFPTKSTIIHHLRNDRLDEARRLFNETPFRDPPLYTMMIAGCTKLGRINDALKLFDEMPLRDVVAWNSMIKGCLDCRDVETAWKMFCEMPERNVVSWTTMLNGFAQSGDIEMAQWLFEEMPQRDVAAWNSMISGYFLNDRIEDARELFKRMHRRNVISWTAMIDGLDKSGRSEEALCLFGEMLVHGIQPTSTTFSSVLTACANTFSFGRGVQIHAHFVKSGFVFDAYVATSLITLYANCGQIDNSLKIFKEVSHRDVVICTALISGYALNGAHKQALKVLLDMTKMGIYPNNSSFTSSLNSCCALEALDTGKEIHSLITKLGLDGDVFVANSLIFLYAKCGVIDDGLMIFNGMGERNLVSWNSIIVGCAQNGRCMMALDLFEKMKLAQVQPDEITFVGLLNGCSHSRMLDKAKYLFELMKQNVSLNLTIEHYVCMVDVLCRCGKLDEAEEFIEHMPMKANSMIWLVLLSACRPYNDAIEVAERAANSVVEMEPNNSAAYVLLSNVYASVGRWNDVLRIRMIMKERQILKQPATSKGIIA